MKNKFIITFAGVIGSSKTPISNYLSTRLNLPTYNNDAVRTEVIEDLGRFDEIEFLKRRDERLEYILKQGHSFILDASVDREWKNNVDILKKLGYEVFIISLDLSRDFLHNLHTVKAYEDSIKRLDELIMDHNNFLNSYSLEIGMHITDKEFPERLEYSLNSARKWLMK